MSPEFGARHASAERFAVLAALLATSHVPVAAHRPAVLEVGSYEGESALFWSAQLAERGGGAVVCVDTWRPYVAEQQGDHYRRMDADLESGEVYRRFLANVAQASPLAPVLHFRGTLIAYLLDFSQRSIHKPLFDLVYVDGDHTFSAVLEDLIQARELVRPGGILCGDDLERPLRTWDDAREAEAHGDVDYVQGYHPGVSRAVWKTFGPDVWARSGVWAMRRGEGRACEREGWRIP